MTINLFVHLSACLFVSRSTQILLFGAFPEKNKKIGLSPTQIPLSFESNLDDRLDTKRNHLDFTIYLLLHALAEVCTL